MPDQLPEAKSTPAPDPALATSARLEELVGLLDLERIELNLFRARHPEGRRGRLYGGQIMAQALRAAVATVDDDRRPHSLHGYFLRPGDPGVPALIDVERIRDGRSFATRRVVVIQHGQAILNLDVSFQVDEPGLSHQMEMPPLVPPPAAKIPAELKEAPFIAWREEHKALKEEAPHPPQQHIWFRASGQLADDPVLHTCLLVYESDNALLSTGRLPHRGSFKRERMQMASLDHAMWFHRHAVTEWRVDRWLLYVLDSPSSSAARGYNRGMIFTEDGVLVATTMQEGLMRHRASS
ncbi:MAG: acyl-CoA thioesterase II [Pseudomonadales bacterium]